MSSLPITHIKDAAGICRSRNLWRDCPHVAMVAFSQNAPLSALGREAPVASRARAWMDPGRWEGDFMDANLYRGTLVIKMEQANGGFDAVECPTARAAVFASVVFEALRAVGVFGVGKEYGKNQQHEYNTRNEYPINMLRTLLRHSREPLKGYRHAASRFARDLLTW